MAQLIPYLLRNNRQILIELDCAQHVKYASPPVLHRQKKLKSRLCDHFKENFDEKLHNFQQKSKKIRLFSSFPPPPPSN